MNTDLFAQRHIGPRDEHRKQMLEAVGVGSIDELINQTVPKNIRLQSPLMLEASLSEQKYLEHIYHLASKNKVFKSFIGMGYHPSNLPAVIQRNILENPGWYTAYTPYQAEIAQGRLEALLNFQTMVIELTGMTIANASLLDEATAAAEALIMFYNSRSRADIQAGRNKFFVDQNALPQSIDVMKGRALNLGIEFIVGDAQTFTPDATYFGIFVQYPNAKGHIQDWTAAIASWKAAGIQVAVGADLLSLVLLKSPGSMGADVVMGSAQRFGVPMGYGGPHAAFFATKEDYKRNLPGRIIGVSKDADDNQALRMALQTREQHIKRDKATSNICTAQALLAVMASMYAVYHGPAGIKQIANHVHGLASSTANALQNAGIAIGSAHFFDTVHVQGVDSKNIRSKAEAAGLNFHYISDSELSISFGEPHTAADVAAVLAIFGAQPTNASNAIPAALVRTEPVLSHPVFNSYHSESRMMRYLKRLENKDLSLVHSMIALGSCTMKLNAASEMMAVTNPQFANMHPFAPLDQAVGYHEMFAQLAQDLCEATGFAAVSLQPNSGAQGEYAGLMVIKAYHESRGDFQRKKMIIPSSAHGTNPASAVMAGFKVVVVACDAAGNIDVADLTEKAIQHKDHLGALMVTYPSTHGVFEETIMDICNTIHVNGGMVYMDGANMNAQVGLTSPGNIGADVCHLNLHKTFAIPHGGGGPGVGPICVNDKLAPFLPGHIKNGDATNAVSGAPLGSASILLISYAYIKMLGAEGLTLSTAYAIMNANYMKSRLEQCYPILYAGKNGTCAHEFIVDLRPFKQTAGVEAEDVAKRLIDYGFHAPTMSFPVAGTIMIEPTESEDKAELDRFCDAMISIRKEISSASKENQNNPLKNAPHTQEILTADAWELPYTRKQAAFPLAYIADNKFWPTVQRVDDAFGDRNLICSCNPIEDYL